MATVQPQPNNGGVGILYPQLSNQFRVKIFPTAPTYFRQWSKDTCELFSMQAVSAAADFKKKIFSVIVEQPQDAARAKDLLTLFKHLEDGEGDARSSYLVEMLDANNNVCSAVLFRNCTCVNHLLNLDYALTDTVQHAFVFEFDVYEIK